MGIKCITILLLLKSFSLQALPLSPFINEGREFLKKQKQSKEWKLRFSDVQIFSYLKKRGFKVKALKDGSYQLTNHAKLLRPALKASKKMSYLFDYKQIAFVELKRIFESSRKAQENLFDRLEKFIWDYINKKGAFRGIEPASFSAITRQGDSSEHAILLCAMIRLYRHPCNVIRGKVLYPSDGKDILYGRHWVLAYDVKKKQWERLDPLIYDEALFPKPIYFPSYEIQDESKTFSLSHAKAQTLRILSLQALP